MTTKQAAVYCRISLDATAEGLGVERQEKACRKLASERGWKVGRVFTDNDISASSGKRRPAFEELKAALKNGTYTAVVTYATDRMYRSTRELDDLIDLVEDSGVTFETVAGGSIDLSTPDGRQTARILASVARGEVEKMSARRRLRLVEDAKVGKAHGGTNCFGYRWKDGRLVVHEPEAALIREAADDVLRGRPVTNIVADWNARGVKTRRGGPWRLVTLKTLLLAPTVAGLRTHTPNTRMHKRGTEATITPGTWQAIVDPTTQELLRSVLVNDERSKKLGGRYLGRKLLSGLATCGCTKPEHKHPGGVCGSAMRSHANGYVCDGANNGQRGGCTRVNRDRVDDYVFLVALQHYVDVDAPAMKKAQPTNGKERARVERRSYLLERMKAKREDYAADIIDGTTLKVALAKLEAEVRDIEKQLGALTASRPRKVQEPHNLFEGAFLGGKHSRDLDEAERQELREFLESIIERLVIEPGGQGKAFDPMRVHITWRQS